VSCYLRECSGEGRAHLCVDAERLAAALHLAEVGEAIAHEEQNGIQEQGVVVGVSFVFVEFLWLGERGRVLAGRRCDNDDDEEHAGVISLGRTHLP
jgi:hypothetical protein